MFEPVRGGTRGGQAEFKWADVSADKDREHYLGHSINAPTGRWQKNKDVHWYNRDKMDGDEERNAEIRKIKELEAEALSIALGFEPKKPSESAGPTDDSPTTSKDSSARAAVKEEKRKRKEARNEEKRAKKEARRTERAGRHGSEDDRREGFQSHYGQDLDSRSRSPRRRSASPRRRKNGGEYDPRRRSRSPRISYKDERETGNDYDRAAMERERERDRRRWDMNASRDRPSRSRYP